MLTHAEDRGIPQDKWLKREPLVEKMFALTDTMGPYEPSTMIDLVKNRPLEVEYIFSNPLERAQVRFAVMQYH
jgi:ketopantoate reductase